jgi:hypothetical protein
MIKDNFSLIQEFLMCIKSNHISQSCYSKFKLYLYIILEMIKPYFSINLKHVLSIKF